MWVHLADGQIVASGPLPTKGTDVQGRAVANFHLLPPADIEAAGWVEAVETDPPDTAPGEQAIGQVELVDGVPTVTWTVVDVPVPDGHYDPQIGVLHG